MPERSCQRRHLPNCLIIALGILLASAPKATAAEELGAWIEGVRTEGLRKGISSETLEFLADKADGDARVALGALEVAAATVANGQIDLDLAQESLQKKALLYDKGADEHYNVISAFIKSMRGSDPDAALYWLARMIEVGEDPLFIVRRMVIFASEDVGNADPRALQMALAVQQAVHFVGLPEARISLAQGVTYLATAPKSNASYVGIKQAQDEVRNSGALPVPKHIRNAPTKLMQELDYGKGYQYAHDHKGGVARQEHLPDTLVGTRYYRPTERGYEKMIGENREPLREFSGRGLNELTQFIAESRLLVADLTRLTVQIERDPARFFFGDSQKGFEAK